MGQTTTQITGQKSPPSPAGKGQKPKAAKHEDTEKAARTTQSPGRSTSASGKHEPPAPSQQRDARARPGKTGAPSPISQKHPQKRAERGPQAPTPKTPTKPHPSQPSGKSSAPGRPGKTTSPAGEAARKG